MVNSRARARVKPVTSAGPATPALDTSALIERFFNRRLRLSQLRLLAAIAESGQLRKVAEGLSVSPPAVSKQIAEIEAGLGRTVVERAGRGVALTEVGELLARRARELLDHLERTRVEVDGLCSGMAGAVGVGAVPSVAPLFLPALVMSLRQRTPNVAVRLEDAVFDRLAPMLEDSSLDLVLARQTTHRLTPGFRQQEVLEDPIAVVCGAQHTLASRPSVDWAELSGMPWIVPARGSVTAVCLDRLLSIHKLALPAGCVESPSWSVNARLLQAYPFVTLMPRAYARHGEGRAGLHVLPLATDGMLNSVKAVWRRDNDNPAIPLLLDAIARRARQL